MKDKNAHGRRNRCDISMSLGKSNGVTGIQLIRRLWGYDWFGFVVGSRYLIVDRCQIRLALSVQENNTDELSQDIIFPVPTQPGRYVFLLHNVCIQPDNSLFLADMNLNSYALEINDSDFIASVFAQAIDILDSISDSIYKNLCTFSGEIGHFGRSLQTHLSDFNIVQSV